MRHSSEGDESRPLEDLFSGSPPDWKAKGKQE